MLPVESLRQSYKHYHNLSNERQQTHALTISNFGAIFNPPDIPCSIEPTCFLSKATGKISKTPWCEFRDHLPWMWFHIIFLLFPKTKTLHKLGHTYLSSSQLWFISLLVSRLPHRKLRGYRSREVNNKHSIYRNIWSTVWPYKTIETHSKSKPSTDPSIDPSKWRNTKWTS